MNNYISEATKYTPYIELDAETNRLLFRGKSTPENTFEFYQGVLEWLKKYFESPKIVDIVFNIPYFNSSSSRVLYDIFDIFEEARQNGSSVSITWEYAKGNENGHETGEEFSEDFEDLQLTLKEVDE